MMNQAFTIPKHGSDAQTHPGEMGRAGSMEPLGPRSEERFGMGRWEDRTERELGNGSLEK